MAAIAQLVEQLTCNEKVQGSTPCGGTRGVLQGLLVRNWRDNKRRILIGLLGWIVGVLRKRGTGRFFALSGGVPEWSKGSDCKSDGLAFEGSNPSPSTTNVKGLVYKNVF